MMAGADEDQLLVRPDPLDDGLPEMSQIPVIPTPPTSDCRQGGPNVTAGEVFVRRDGLLYQRYQPPGADEEAQVIEQLVLPTCCRPAVLQLAHDIPMSGHLGKKKTAKRVLQRFYWPGLYRNIQDYCRTCAQCQKSPTRRVRKAPLVSLPIMDVPFRRIAIDIHL